MAAKLVFLVGVLGIGGYVYNKASNYDPAVLPYSREQAQMALEQSTTTLPRRDGDGEIRIWAAGPSSNGVTLQMQYASDAPVLTCEAVITEMGPNESRVVPDCGGADSADAIAATENKLRVPMFEEHIQSTLRKRAFNRDIVTQKEMAVVMNNMGGMQREALKRSDEAQRMASEASQ